MLPYWRMPSRETLGQVLAATVFALAGATLAYFVWPQMHRSDALLRDGVRAEATVVALDATTCTSSSFRKSWPYPCFEATGQWTHDGVVYRSTLGHYKDAAKAPLGTTVAIVFAPDPAAAVGKVDLQMRVVGAGRDAPRSERPVYLGLLVLAALLCVPLPVYLIKALRG